MLSMLLPTTEIYHSPTNTDGRATRSFTMLRSQPWRQAASLPTNQPLQPTTSFALEHHPTPGPPGAAPDLVSSQCDATACDTQRQTARKVRPLSGGCSLSAPRGTSAGSPETETGPYQQSTARQGLGGSVRPRTTARGMEQGLQVN